MSSEYSPGIKVKSEAEAHKSDHLYPSRASTGPSVSDSKTGVSSGPSSPLRPPSAVSRTTSVDLFREVFGDQVDVVNGIYSERYGNDLVHEAIGGTS